MSNHGWVKTLKFMKPEQITLILEELNNSLFKGIVEIEYHKSTKENPSYGPYTWILTSNSDRKQWFKKICWLNTSRHFEMRHGSGTDFDWWIDTVIINEIAVRFSGKIGDDGISDRWEGISGKYNKFNNYLSEIFSFKRLQKTTPEIRNLVLEEKLKDTPIEFHEELKLHFTSFENVV